MWPVCPIPPLGPPLALRHRLTGLPYPTSPTYPTDWRPPLAKRGTGPPLTPLPDFPTGLPFGAHYPHLPTGGPKGGDWPPMAKRAGVA